MINMINILLLIIGLVFMYLAWELSSIHNRLKKLENMNRRNKNKWKITKMFEGRFNKKIAHNILIISMFLWAFYVAIIRIYYNYYEGIGLETLIYYTIILLISIILGLIIKEKKMKGG